ncbi:galactan export ABC transporter permease subunit Wzm/RfbD [Rhodococcoides trifolii]|uniref:galactan export ABC transporter permease subunit Wzm/RfbD n=1 Tax=Rhodococcoides trifolii TaxID=908250 RepID=UPI0016694386
MSDRAASGNQVGSSLVSDSQTLSRAFRDLREGYGQRELWLSLGWQDIKQRYRRSVIGPFWITIATGVQAAAMGVLYSALLDQPISQFLPYVTVGLIIWNLISASILEGSEVFVANEGLIKQLPSALSVHIYRLVWRQLLLLAHNLVIYVVILAAFGVWRELTWASLTAIPALVLIIMNSLWVSFVFGIFATRYRDIAPILGSLILLLFVLTPIMWTTEALSGAGGQISERAKLAEINPLFHYLAIIRDPMIGQPQKAYHWYIVIAITVFGWLLAIHAMRKYRARVPYWV